MAAMSLEEHHQWLLSTGHFSDLTLHARGAAGCRKKWRLHRSVVVRSPYFQRMLTGDWDEAKKQEIDLECLEVPGLTVDGLNAALHYLYAKKLEMLSMEAFAEALVALKFLLLDDAVTELLKSLDVTLPCKDWQSLTASAALHRETMPGLWKVVLEALCRDPIWVLDHVAEVHPDLLIALVNHSSLRIFKDISRYRLAEQILQALELPQSNGHAAPRAILPPRASPRKRRTPEVESDGQELRNRIFQGFPDWELSQEQVHLIRRSGLVPDTLLLDWWEQHRKGAAASRGFAVHIGSEEVATSIPTSWTRLNESSAEMDLNFGTRCPFNSRINRPFFFHVQKTNGKLSLYCNILVEARSLDRDRQMLLGLQVFQQHGDSRARLEHRSWREVTSTRRHVKFGGLEVEQNTELFVVATLPAGVFSLEMSPLPAL
ncbi:unnamed protein product [Cladocopium goreaui]|uniref:Germ cell-less protein-like 2 (Germ cell-less protein-like 1-like) n=1 Tax=Cladocopium goreaui TaxID=2562237 RepID=A0A9P1GS03_9DINO|nr:unnamed protein product [Cladocopium goreaui]